MKLTSQTMRSTGSPMSSKRRCARVDAFVQHHARVGAQLPVELAGADIHGVHARGAGLQQASVKPPVEEPISRQTLPATSMAKWRSAAASLKPPRLT